MQPSIQDHPRISFLNPILKNYMRVIHGKIEISKTDLFPSSGEFKKEKLLDENLKYFRLSELRLNSDEKSENKYILLKNILNAVNPDVVECKFDQLELVREMLEKKIWNNLFFLICHISSNNFETDEREHKEIPLMNEKIRFFIFIDDSKFVKKNKELTYSFKTPENKVLPTIIYCILKNDKKPQTPQGIGNLFIYAPTGKEKKTEYSNTEIYSSNPVEVNAEMPLYVVNKITRKILNKKKIISIKLNSDGADPLLDINLDSSEDDVKTNEINPEESICFFIHNEYNPHFNNKITISGNEEINYFLLFTNFKHSEALKAFKSGETGAKSREKYIICSDSPIEPGSKKSYFYDKFFNQKLSPMQILKPNVQFEISTVESFFPFYSTYSIGENLDYYTTIYSNISKKQKKASVRNIQNEIIKQLDEEEKRNYARKTISEKNADLLLLSRYQRIHGLSLEEPFINEYFNEMKINSISASLKKNVKNQTDYFSDDDFKKFEVTSDVTLSSERFLYVQLSPKYKCSIYNCDFLVLYNPEKTKAEVYLSGNIHTLYIIGSNIDVKFDCVSKMENELYDSPYDNFSSLEEFKNAKVFNKYYNQVIENKHLFPDAKPEKTAFTIPFKRAVVKNIYMHRNKSLENTWGLVMFLNKYYI